MHLGTTFFMDADFAMMKKCHNLKQSNDLTLHTHSIHIEECCNAIVANQTTWLTKWNGFPYAVTEHPTTILTANQNFSQSINDFSINTHYSLIFDISLGFSNIYNSYPAFKGWIS